MNEAETRADFLSHLLMSKDFTEYAIEGSARADKQKLAALAELKKSLLHQAFSGQL